jgi:hypothetical protein
MPVFIVKDRRYPVPTRMTFRELSEIKSMTGLRPAEMEQALDLGDPDAQLALLFIAMRRVDHYVTLEDLESLYLDEVRTEEDAPVPPAEAADAAGETPSPTPEPSGVQD